MPHLMAYGMMSTTDNSIVGNLVVARCDFCGKKFGSIEEAKKCESNHIQAALWQRGGRG